MNTDALRALYPEPAPPPSTEELLLEALDRIEAHLDRIREILADEVD